MNCQEVDDADPQLERGAQPICPRVWRADAKAGLSPCRRRITDHSTAGGASWVLAARPLLVLSRSQRAGSHYNRRYPWGLVRRHSDLRVSGLLPPHGSVCPRPLPSLLPGFLGPVRRLSIGTMKRLRLPPRFFRRSVRHIATQYPGLAWRFRSWRRASPLPPGPEVVKPVPPSRRLVPRTRLGLPCSQETPVCLGPVLRPRPVLGT